MYKYKSLQITKYIHDGFRIDTADKIIYIDPFKLPENQPKADYILISHEHFDHMDWESISKIIGSDTVVVGNALVKGGLGSKSIKNFIELAAGDSKEFSEFKVTARAAYNINKFREEGRPFHPKESGGLGFYLEFPEGEVVYHTGDTDLIPEVSEVKNVDVLMVPISGTYVMDSDEASEATNTINPKVAIPMHFDGGFIGSSNDLEDFKSKVKCEVVVLEPEK